LTQEHPAKDPHGSSPPMLLIPEKESAEHSEKRAGKKKRL
jgi:hypothetical protein